MPEGRSIQWAACSGFRRYPKSDAVPQGTEFLVSYNSPTNRFGSYCSSDYSRQICSNAFLLGAKPNLQVACSQPCQFPLGTDTVVPGCLRAIAQRSINAGFVPGATPCVALPTFVQWGIAAGSLRPRRLGMPGVDGNE